jgi:hypothetical protein
MSQINIRLFLFAVIIVACVCIVGTVINRGFKKIDFGRAALWMAAVAMIGVLGEISVDAAYRHFFGTPLWRYNFLPVHHAYTSAFAPVLWGAFGFYLYLVHHSYDRWSPKQLVRLAIIFGFEALILEALTDLIAKPTLGDYIYYYYPNGLWHISAFQNFIFYFLCGYLIIHTIHWFKSNPHFFTIISTWVVIVTVYIK